MRGKDLLDALGYADADLINKTAVTEKKAPLSAVLLRYGAIAAVFAVLLGTALIFPHFRHNKPVLPIDTTDTDTKDTENTSGTESTDPGDITTDAPVTNPPDTDTDSVDTTAPDDITTDTPVTDPPDTDTGSVETTAPIDTPVIIPQTGEWMRFTVLGKDADYIKLSNKQISEVNYKDNPLMYIEDEYGVWMFWSIAEGGGKWTVEDILKIYGIASDNDIKALNSERNNASNREEKSVTSRELISEFYGIIKNAEITHYSDRRNNPELSQSSDYRENEHRIEEGSFNLYIDVITQNGDVFPLILSPFADDLRREETYYRIEDGKGKRMFEILRGITVDEYEEMVVKEKARNNAISEQFRRIHSIFPIDPENPSDYLYPDDFGGTYRGDDGYLHVNITIPIDEASHYTSLVDPDIVRFHTVKFSYTYLKEAYDIIRPHMLELGIFACGVMKSDNKVSLKIASEESIPGITAFLSSASIPEDCCEIILGGAIVPQ